jgi:DnaK suppressor protein
MSADEQADEPGELTAADAEALRATLLQLRGTLTQQLADVERGSKPVDLDEPIGRLSRMDALQQQQMASANAAAARRRLGLVGRALTALDDESYGECLTCEEPIELARLRARPETPRCLRCQGALER